MQGLQNVKELVVWAVIACPELLLGVSACVFLLLSLRVVVASSCRHFRRGDFACLHVCAVTQLGDTIRQVVSEAWVHCIHRDQVARAVALVAHDSRTASRDMTPCPCG